MTHAETTYNRVARIATKKQTMDLVNWLVNLRRSDEMIPDNPTITASIEAVEMELILRQSQGSK